MTRPARFRLPAVAGHLACRKVLTAPFDGLLIDAVCAHYREVSRGDWEQRFASGHVFDSHGRTLQPDERFRAPLELHYYRPFTETPLPVRESILFQDEHLVVVDKPHFLPVHPAGKYLRETLVSRVIERLGNPQLSPLHRLDRATAGLVLFSCNRTTRAAYQNLFRDRHVGKRYEALAPPLRISRFRCSAAHGCCGTPTGSVRSRSTASRMRTRGSRSSTAAVRCGAMRCIRTPARCTSCACT